MCEVTVSRSPRRARGIRSVMHVRSTVSFGSESGSDCGFDDDHRLASPRDDGFVDIPSTEPPASPATTCALGTEPPATPATVSVPPTVVADDALNTTVGAGSIATPLTLDATLASTQPAGSPTAKQATPSLLEAGRPAPLAIQTSSDDATGVAGERSLNSSSHGSAAGNGALLFDGSFSTSGERPPAHPLRRVGTASPTGRSQVHGGNCKIPWLYINVTQAKRRQVDLNASGASVGGNSGAWSPSRLLLTEARGGGGGVRMCASLPLSVVTATQQPSPTASEGCVASPMSDPGRHKDQQLPTTPSHWHKRRPLSSMTKKLRWQAEPTEPAPKEDFWFYSRKMREIAAARKHAKASASSTSNAPAIVSPRHGQLQPLRAQQAEPETVASAGCGTRA